MKPIISLLCFVLLFISCDDIIEEVDISNTLITILAPTNNSILDTTIVTFSWNTHKDIETYRLQIATPDFENATQIVLDTLVSKTNHTQTLDYKDYEWRIRGENSVYQTEYTINSFIVEE